MRSNITRQLLFLCLQFLVTVRRFWVTMVFRVPTALTRIRTTLEGSVRLWKDQYDLLVFIHSGSLLHFLGPDAL